MFRNVDPPKRMQAIITLMTWAVTYQNTSSCFEFKFVFVIGPKIRVSGTTKDPENRAVWLLKKKFEIRWNIIQNRSKQFVYEKNSSLKCIKPEAKRQIGLS